MLAESCMSIKKMLTLPAWALWAGSVALLGGLNRTFLNFENYLQGQGSEHASVNLGLTQTLHHRRMVRRPL